MKQNIEDVESWIDNGFQEPQQVPCSGRHHETFWLMLGSILLGFTIMVLPLFPLFSKHTPVLDEVDMSSGFLEDAGNTTRGFGDDPPGDDPGPSDDNNSSILRPFLYEDFVAPVNSFGMGNTTFKIVNWSFWQNWVNTSIVSRLEKSKDGKGHWADCSRLLVVDKDWNESNVSVKFTFSWVSDEDSFYRVSYEVCEDSGLESYFDESAKQENSNRFLLNCSITESESYDSFWDWSDYKNSKEYDVSSFSKEIKSNSISNKPEFFWVVTTDSILKKGSKFVVDPTFGETNIATGSMQSMIYNGNENLIGSWFTLSVSGSVSVESMSIYISDGAESSWGDPGDFAYITLYIYEYVSLGDAGEQLGYTDELTIEGGDTVDQYFTLDMSSNIDLDGGTYYLVACCSQRTTYDSDDSLYLCAESETDKSIRDLSRNANANDPLTGESKWNYKYGIYATYNITNYYPTITNPSPTNNAYNISITNSYNVTVIDADGNNSVVDFYISTDNSSWSHIGHNTSILNESVSVDLTGDITYDTLYYMKTTANDTHGNISFYSSFETTPYRTLFFNDTFPSDNWILSNTNMGFSNGYSNLTCGETTTNLFFDQFTSDYGSYTMSGGGRTSETHDGYCMNIDNADSATGTAFDATGYDSILVDFWVEPEGTDAGEELKLQWFDGTTIQTVSTNDSEAGGWTDYQWQHEKITISSSSYTFASNSYVKFLSAAGYEDWNLDDIYIKGVASHSNGTLISKSITKSSGTWDKFYADVNNTANSTFSLIDPSTSYSLISSLVGNGDDISSVTNSTVRIRGDFNATLSLDSWNITWTSAGANNAPTQSNPSPTNGSTGESKQPRCAITVSDADSDTMDVTFASNYSGSWTNYQTNTTISTGSTCRWDFTGANSYSTKYWWKVYADDSTDNISKIYHFTTKAAPSWQTISDTINGAFTNTTTWTTISDNINGAFTNSTSWKTISDTMNGGFTNTTAWHTVSDTMNGVFTSVTAWQTIDDTINGAFTNTTAWQTISDTMNGGFTNTTAWHIVSDTMNGVFTSVTVWQTIDDTINGAFTNSTSWNTISDSINGAFTNSTSWVLISNNINGAFTNTTAWRTISDTINGAFTNSTSWTTISDNINGAFTNSTSWVTISDSINGSFYNISTTWHTLSDTINGEYTNTSILVADILVTNIYPVNQSCNQNYQPTVVFVINHTEGKKINYTIYIGTSIGDINTVLGSGYNLTNSTCYFNNYYDATDTGTTYYWRINLWDNISVNKNYTFSFKLFKPGGLVITNNDIGIIGLMGVVGVIGLLLNQRRKQKNKEEDEDL